MDVRDNGRYVVAFPALEFPHQAWERIVDGAKGRGISVEAYIGLGAENQAYADLAERERRRRQEGEPTREALSPREERNQDFLYKPPFEEPPVVIREVRLLRGGGLKRNEAR